MNFIELKSNLKKYRENDNANKIAYIKRNFDNIDSDYIQEIKNIVQSDDKSLICDYIIGVAKKCPTCGKYFRGQYKQITCSKECSVSQRKNTCIEKYGVENPLSNKEIRQKCNETYFKEHGVYNPSNNPDVVKKRKNTCLEHFGCEVPMQSDEIKRKSKETCQKKYNTDTYTQTQEFKRRAISTNLKKYGVEWTQQNKEIRTKTENTCLAKYGSRSYLGTSKRIRDSLKYSIENLRKILREYHMEDIAPSDLEKYNIIKENELVFDMSSFMDEYNVPLDIAYRIKRCFHIDTPNYFRNHGRSKGEEEIFNFIASKGIKAIHNDRTLLAPKELDIVIPSIKLAIEYDGNYWHSSKFRDSKYHIEKTKKCKERGYQLFHIFEFDDLDIWKSIISNKLNLNEKIYARKCTLKKVPHAETVEFLEENHLQGSCPSSINLGLYYEEELVQIMTFGKPRFSNDCDYELLRLCTKKFKNVVGGTSKLFKAFRSEYKGSVISYANLRFSSGEIYNKLGFENMGDSAPNYFYTKNERVLTRYQCQKHKLKELLEVFDPELTEVENMELNGFDRIFDCGNSKFRIE